jgi:hypothetical protein
VAAEGPTEFLACQDSVPAARSSGRPKNSDLYLIVRLGRNEKLRMGTPHLSTSKWDAVFCFCGMALVRFRLRRRLHPKHLGSDRAIFRWGRIAPRPTRK